MQLNQRTYAGFTFVLGVLLLLMGAVVFQNVAVILVGFVVCVGGGIWLSRASKSGQAEGDDLPTPPTRMQREVAERANHRCEIPGCRARGNLEFHHISNPSDHNPTDIAYLCPNHRDEARRGNFSRVMLQEYVNESLRREQRRTQRGIRQGRPPRR